MTCALAIGATRGEADTTMQRGLGDRPVGPTVRTDHGTNVENRDRIQPMRLFLSGMLLQSDHCSCNLD
ncbi:hypothetical protein U9M48_040289 [Paspalum notatum var. saurae]|uniref:Uncharacterized protein n=1 Tax=Paspalum notatum var. saurae TaxID=547442 RepID=A0AAQ3XE03_PASNO